MNELWINIEEAHKTGVDSINNISLNLIIFSTALLTFTITFVEKLDHFSNKNITKNWLAFAWLFLLISIIIGCSTLFKIAGFLLDYNGGKIKESILLQLVFQFLTFCLAILFIFIFAFKSTLKFNFSLKKKK